MDSGQAWLHCGEVACRDQYVTYLLLRNMMENANERRGL